MTTTRRVTTCAELAEFLEAVIGGPGQWFSSTALKDLANVVSRLREMNDARLADLVDRASSAAPTNGKPKGGRKATAPDEAAFGVSRDEFEAVASDLRQRFFKGDAAAAAEFVTRRGEWQHLHDANPLERAAAALIGVRNTAAFSMADNGEPWVAAGQLPFNVEAALETALAEVPSPRSKANWETLLRLLGWPEKVQKRATVGELRKRVHDGCIEFGHRARFDAWRDRPHKQSG